MKIVLLQTDIQWQEPQKNRDRAKELINNSPQADLYILPEMFTTGFCMTPKGVAEKADTITLAWMQALAKEKNAAIAGSVATEENGKYYNRFYFVKPDGNCTTYDKRHLFTFAGEHNQYSAGEERIIVDHAGFRILLQICYDLRFPVFSRNRGDYDMIIYVANWPTVRLEAWNALLKARAIENVCYVAAVNRTGDDYGNKYTGGTYLIDFMGKTIIAAEEGKEEAIAGETNMEALMDFRKKFPALQDADMFKITE